MAYDSKVVGLKKPLEEELKKSSPSICVSWLFSAKPVLVLQCGRGS